MLGSADLITVNAGKQFMTKEFKQYATNMRIIVKNIPIEVHHFIQMLKRYYQSLQRVYIIITTKILEIVPDWTLQMSFMTINDLVNSNKLVSTLLVFAAYCRITR